MSNHFLHPTVLILLVIPAALLCWIWRRSSRNLILPFDHGRPGNGIGWRVLISIFESAPPLLLALALVLLSGPQRQGTPRGKRVLTNIELCLDVSGSMTTPFGDASRYDTAMKSLDEFLTFRKGDAFGLTFFGNNVLHWVPLTSDVSAIRCSPPFMRPENAPDWMGGTDIGKALRACAKVLCERQEGDRMIVLVTDGEDTGLSGGNDKEIAKELKANNISVFAVIIQEHDQTDIQDEIINITHLTEGEAFLAGDARAMTGIFRRIDQMKQTRVDRTIGETVDDFVPWAIVGLSLAGAAMISLWGLRYTPW